MYRPPSITEMLAAQRQDERLREAERERLLRAAESMTPAAAGPRRDPRHILRALLANLGRLRPVGPVAEAR